MKIKDWKLVEHSSEEFSIYSGSRTVCTYSIDSELEDEEYERELAIAEDDFNLILKAPALYERLKEVTTDLTVLWGNMADIEKTNYKAQGMKELIQEWINKNKEILK